MIQADPLLFELLLLLDKLPQPRLRLRRGRPARYPETLFLKALVIMTLRHLYKVSELPSVLDEPQMQAIKHR